MFLTTSHSSHAWLSILMTLLVRGLSATSAGKLARRAIRRSMNSNASAGALRILLFSINSADTEHSIANSSHSMVTPGM